MAKNYIVSSNRFNFAETVDEALEANWMNTNLIPAMQEAIDEVSKEAVKKLWLTENSKDFKYLQYYEGLARMRGALIKKEYGTAFGIDEYAKRIVMDT